MTGVQTCALPSGVEASLRRLAHYDYIKDKVRPSILVESDADLLVYGMAEKTIVEIADALQAKFFIHDLSYIRGIVYRKSSIESVDNPLILPHFNLIKSEKKAFAQSYNIQYHNTDAINGKVLVEPYDNFYVIQNKPALPLEQEYFDWVYSLNYERNYHPS